MKYKIVEVSAAIIAEHAELKSKGGKPLKYSSAFQMVRRYINGEDVPEHHLKQLKKYYKKIGFPKGITKIEEHGN